MTKIGSCKTLLKPKTHDNQVYQSTITCHEELKKYSNQASCQKFKYYKDFIGLLRKADCGTRQSAFCTSVIRWLPGAESQEFLKLTIYGHSFYFNRNFQLLHCTHQLQGKVFVEITVHFHFPIHRATFTSCVCLQTYRYHTQGARG